MAEHKMPRAFRERSKKVGPVQSPDATDLASAITLLNEIKAKLNEMNASED